MKLSNSDLSIKESFSSEKSEMKTFPLYKELLEKYNYQKVKNYPSIEQIIPLLMTTTSGKNERLLSDYNPDYLREDETQQYSVLTAYDIYRKDIPFYWLDKELLNLLLETDLPLLIGDLKIPFKEAMILLPNNVISSPNNLPLNWFFFKYLDANQVWGDIHVKNWLNGEPHRIKFVPVKEEKIIWTSQLKKVLYKGKQSLINGELKRKGLRIASNSFAKLEDDKEKELEFGNFVNDLVIKILLFMQIYPQIFEEVDDAFSLSLNGQSTLSKLKKNRGNKNQKKAPRWIKQTKIGPSLLLN